MDKILTAFIMLKRAWYEPSTHAAISSICATTGISLNDSLIGHIFTVLAIPFGIAGIWLKEAKPLTEIK
ncbi:MAG: hypothetical protein WC967_15575 [Balneolaceae bacterium]